MWSPCYRQIILDGFRTTTYRRLASRQRAHPAKAGAAKPRVLASPAPSLRGTPKIAELLRPARRLSFGNSRSLRGEVRYGSTCHCPFPDVSVEGADGTGAGAPRR